MKEELAVVSKIECQNSTPQTEMKNSETSASDEVIALLRTPARKFSPRISKYSNGWDPASFASPSLQFELISDCLSARRAQKVEEKRSRKLLLRSFGT